jgi:hypothetical protein
MGLVDWKFVFKRRKWTLENYLSSCKTLDDAMLKFKKDGMLPPSKEDLSNYINFSSEKTQEVSTTSLPPKKSFNKNKVQNKKNLQVKKDNSNEKSAEYDDIIVLEDKR